MFCGYFPFFPLWVEERFNPTHESFNSYVKLYDQFFLFSFNHVLPNVNANKSHPIWNILSTYTLPVHNGSLLLIDMPCATGLSKYHPDPKKEFCI